MLEGQRVPAAEASHEDQLVCLMQQHERSIYNFVFALLRDADLALDCAQDTFVRAYENLRKSKPVNTAWLYTVARNRAMDEFRRRRHVQPESDISDVPAAGDTDRRLVVQEVLDRLTPQDREVLYLFDVAGFKSHEIGAMLGIRDTAIRQRLSRARERFRLIYGAIP